MPRYMNFEYSRIGSEIRIYKYKGSAKSVNIPVRIDGLPVTSIGSSAFENCSSLKSINIPKGVTSIENWAFSGCSSLESITIPEGVTSVENRAFKGCSSLKSINIPKGVTSVGDGAFFGCSSLESITIPKGVTSIGKYAFSDCESLKSITIPDSVTSIGEHAFSDCESLKSITIPKGVTSIGKWTFSFCSSLESITILEGVTFIGYSAFESCKSLRAIHIPETVKKFGGGAILPRPFEGCSGLEDIYLPTSLMSIESIANAVNQVCNEYHCKVHCYNYPSSFFYRIQNLRNLSNLSSNLVREIERLENFMNSSNYSGEMNTELEKIFKDIEKAYQIGQKIDNVAASDICPASIFQRIDSLKSLCHGHKEILGWVNEINSLAKEDYSNELNSSVENLLTEIAVANDAQSCIERGPIVSLMALVNKISDKKVINGLKYVSKLNGDLALLRTQIENGIKTVNSDKAVIQKRRNAPKTEIENQIKNSVEDLITRRRGSVKWIV